METGTDTSPGVGFADTSDVMETETDTSPGVDFADTSDVMETETDTSPGTKQADTSDVMETETDTSPGVGFADTSDVMLCDQYNENPTGGADDGAGVPKKKPFKMDFTKDDDADVIDTKYVITEISLYITKFKKERSDIRETWTEMLRCIMDICRTKNVEKYECAKLCHQFSRVITKSSRQ